MQRLNTFTNNKNNLNLGIESDLMLGIDNANDKSKNSNQTGFIDIAAFNSGDLIQRKKQGSLNKMELALSPNVLKSFFIQNF